MHTVESIKSLLATNDKAIGRALIVLRNRQTADEQASETLVIIMDGDLGRLMREWERRWRTSSKKLGF